MIKLVGIGAALVGLLVGAALGNTYGHWRGYQAGVAATEARVQIEVAAERKRQHDAAMSAIEADARAAEKRAKDDDATAMAATNVETAAEHDTAACLSPIVTDEQSHALESIR